MRKIYVIQTRFSVFNKNIASIWRLGRNRSEAEVVAELFDKKRLELRCNIFFNISLPLLHKAYLAGHEIFHSLLYSTHLPDWVVNKIEAAKDCYCWFHPLGVGYEEEVPFYSSIKQIVDAISINELEDIAYAGIRLDDDDLISTSYFNKLSRYVDQPFSGFAVSFPRGFAGMWEENDYMSFSEFYEPKNAQGLAQINIYNKVTKKFNEPYLLVPGGHLTIDERVPTILDATGKGVFLRTFHSNNDIAIDRNMSEYIKNIMRNTIDFNPISLLEAI